MSTVVSNLDHAMRSGHLVEVTLEDGRVYIGTVLHMTAYKVWMVVGDADRFLPLCDVRHVSNHVGAFRGQQAGA